ncbi:PREDICTED: RNA-binding protein 44-like [Thamnophis sirtalis]|uniref:RNA-binding protein 44-like n=1 Tax=Thamnophis sirtalis TaxID=35019 RepID=A0A6I9Y565_9SAUR|nr:PREDICTED: RNA-binding protein 44-like [Thamnophis sirtalis]XP_013912876.1 PREDICTED: RNA-binding protein 44-like [Thamnophis sirtalis]XP_013912877.1 PREDICTED: RNA-binding protein 44-like [Thamnophis sirtalis]
MECRKCSVEKGADISSILSESQEATCFQKHKVDNTCSDLQMGVEYSISSQSCYVDASCLNLSKENLISSVKEEFTYVHKQQHNTSSAVETTNEININADFSYFKNESAYKCNYFDDGSQLEYHSAEEEDYIDCLCSYRQKTDNSESFQEKEMVNENNVTDQQPLDKPENTFSTSSCVVKDHYNGNEISTFPQMFQDVSCTQNQHITLGEKRNESLSMSYSVVKDSSHMKVNKKKNNSKLFLANKAEIEEKIKVKVLSDTTLKSITATTKEILKTNDYLNTTGNPNILCQEIRLLPFPQISHYTEDSNTYAYKPSVIVNSDIKTSIYSSCEHHENCIGNFSSTDLKCITNTYHESRKNLQSAISQATDAAADFRASFTTSRAINVKSPVASKAQNTVITMMSKCRPREWLAQDSEIMPAIADYRSVGCNTDWSCIPGNLEMIDSQVAISDMLEDCISSDATKHGWKSNSEDPLEWSNISSKDLNEIPYRYNLKRMFFFKTTDSPVIMNENSLFGHSNCYARNHMSGLLKNCHPGFSSCGC